MRNIGITGILTILCLLCGCRRSIPPPDPQAATLAEHAARLARIEQVQLELVDKFDTLSAPPKATASASDTNVVTARAVPAVDQAVLSTIESLVNARVRDVVQATVDDRIGDQQTVQAIFETVVEQEISALEARKEREQEEEQQRRREERAQERTEREQQRFNVFAETLGLSDKQQIAVKTLSDETRDTIRLAMSEMREDGRYSRRDYGDVIEIIRGEQNEVMSEILSQEQYNVYETEYNGRLGRGFGNRDSRRRWSQ